MNVQRIRICQRIALCLGCLLFGVSLFGQNSTNDAASEMATQVIRPDHLRSHMRFLSDSLLQGRAPGTPGYDIAARYVATQLEGMGLQPAVSGSWFQTVPLESAITDTKTSSLVLTVNGKEQKLVDAPRFRQRTNSAIRSFQGCFAGPTDNSTEETFGNAERGTNEANLGICRTRCGSHIAWLRPDDRHAKKAKGRKNRR